MRGSPGVWKQGVVALVGLLTLGGGGSTGCASGGNTVTGRITPEHFEFTRVVKDEPGEPGGWWAVCIHGLITQGDSDAKTVCKFEVGMPARSGQGAISLMEATREVSEDLRALVGY
jgi:hypothetical protein